MELNQLAVADTDEPYQLRDRGLLESAVDNCRNHYGYGNNDLIDLACTLMLSVAKNHPFEQGNKRTGFLAAQAFLRLNGYTWRVPNRQWVADLFIAALSDSDAEHVLRVGIRLFVSQQPEA